MEIQQESIFYPYKEGHLHLRKIAPVGGKPHLTPFFMLHGSISNGRVFYTKSGKGLACSLAKEGYKVYVLDMPGRGLSTPKIARGVNPSQTEVIREVIPSIQAFILEANPLADKVHWLAHSWGGVLMAATMLRYSELQSQVASFVTFGTKRRVSVKNVHRTVMLDLVWKRLSIPLMKLKGYFPAAGLGIGMDNESFLSLTQTFPWLDGDWVDPEDGFDYGAKLSNANLPPAWFFAAKNDAVLGNPKDVKFTFDELQFKQGQFLILSKHNGNRQDYDHANMLTHADAEYDHFIELKQWYKGLKI
ncbi:alpha/beta fold hydrolase [Parashewanella curva]|uniref:Alpha/beta fold hydrolase n=1 Tax=Parashewanella curva TaxID=2338552 RepID=A0A3L8PY01_9GAMM|nr:alpha/beta fold hydrolase [Parashewanella curva]RLV60180.1 alpha/beta fold hydrolase [Parashewanella curva]